MRPQKPAQVQVEILPDGRMDSANAARYIGCSAKTLAHMRCSGKGPSFLKPGRIYYFRADLDSWLAGHGRQRSTAQRRAAEAAQLPEEPPRPYLSPKPDRDP